MLELASELPRDRGRHLRLLEETGYGLSDVEVFYKVLARAVADRRVREDRTEADWPVLVTI